MNILNIKSVKEKINLVENYFSKFSIKQKIIGISTILVALAISVFFIFHKSLEDKIKEHFKNEILLYLIESGCEDKSILDEFDDNMKFDVKFIEIGVNKYLGECSIKSYIEIDEDGIDWNKNIITKGSDATDNILSVAQGNCVLIESNMEHCKSDTIIIEIKWKRKFEFIYDGDYLAIELPDAVKKEQAMKNMLKTNSDSSSIDAYIKYTLSEKNPEEYPSAVIKLKRDDNVLGEISNLDSLGHNFKLGGNVLNTIKSFKGEDIEVKILMLEDVSLSKERVYELKNAYKGYVRGRLRERLLE